MKERKQVWWQTCTISVLRRPRKEHYSLSGPTEWDVVLKPERKGKTYTNKNEHLVNDFSCGRQQMGAGMLLFHQHIKAKVFQSSS